MKFNIDDNRNRSNKLLSPGEYEGELFYVSEKPTRDGLNTYLNIGISINHENESYTVFDTIFPNSQSKILSLLTAAGKQELIQKGEVTLHDIKGSVIGVDVSHETYTDRGGEKVTKNNVKKYIKSNTQNIDLNIKKLSDDELPF